MSTVDAGRHYRILHSLSDLHVGGVAQLLLRNISGMDPSRFDNTVCYLTPRRDLEPQYIEAGFTPVCLDHRGKRHAVRTLLRLIALLKERRIDLVHTNHSLDRMYVGLAAAICNIPVVTTLHSMTMPSNMPGGRMRVAWVRAMLTLEDWTGRVWTRRFVAISNAVRRVSTRYRNLPSDRISVLYSGIPLEYFDCAPDSAEQARLRLELGIERAYPVLINVGRLAHGKGQHLLIHMMPGILERWPEAKLIIAGEGGKRTDLENEIARLCLGASITLLGQRSDVGALLAVSDAFLFPSANEGLGLALLEAAAAGKPIVAANSGAIPEVVEDGASGYLVDPTSPDALARGVLRVLESPERARGMGARGQQIVREKFDLRDSVRGLERVYLSVLKA